MINGEFNLEAVQIKNKFEFNKAYPAVNRRNALGPGPRRNRLPNYFPVGEFDHRLTSLCLELCNRLSGYNDIMGESYNMSKSSPLCAYFPSTYRQILLQSARTTGLFESDYTEDRYPEILEEIRRALPGVDFYRARLAVLPPGQVLDWHIDTDTSVSCRIQFPIKGSSNWSIDRKGLLEEKALLPRQIWFTNTGYLHKVENSGHEDRIVLTIGCSYQSLASHVGEFSFR